MNEVDSNQHAAGYSNFTLDSAEPEEEDERRGLDYAECWVGAQAIQEVPEDAEVGRKSSGNVVIVDSPVSGFEVCAGR